KVLVGLDFDGTLADIAEAPDRAALSRETRELLVNLSQRPDTKVAILSGRRLADLTRMVGLPGIYYAGNHGLEITGPGMSWVHPLAEGVHPSISKGMEVELKDFEGALVEDKHFGLAVHYRLVSPGSHRRFRKRVKDSLARLGERYRILHSKRTFDLRSSIQWDKGRALESIRRVLKGAWMAIFVG